MTKPIDKKTAPEGVKPCMRAASLQPKSVNEEARTIDFTLATDAPVLEWHPDYGVIRACLSMESPDLPEQIPMLDTHNDFSTAKQLGAFRSPKIEIKKNGYSSVVMTAHFGESQAAFDAWRLYSKGLGTDCSVRYGILAQPEYVPDGKTATINGREEAGPLLIIHKWRALEGSLCPIGADSKCKARSADLETNPNTDNTGSNTDNTGSNVEPEPILPISTGERTMKVNEETNPTNQAPAAPVVDTKAAVEAARAEGMRLEAERRSGIEAVCSLANYPTDKARSLVEDAAMTQARALEVVRAWQVEQNKPVPQVRASEIEIGANRSLEHLRNAGAKGLALTFDNSLKIDLKDGVEAYRSGGKERIMRELLRAHNVDSSLMSTKEVIDAVFSRSYVLADFANITADAANIKFANDVAAAETVYQQVCEIGSVDSFKKSYRARLLDSGSMPEVDEDGEYQIAKLNDEGSYIQIKEHGLSIPLSRKLLLDNSLDIRVAAIGRVITRTQLDIENAVFGLLINNQMYDGSQIFTVAHKNIGTAAALSATALDEARILMAAIKGENGQAMGLRPKFVLTGAKYARTAAELTTSASAPDANHAAVANYYKGLTALETSAITDGKWFVLGSAALEPHLEAAFSDGQRIPKARVSEKAGQSGIVIDVNLDWGVACHSWRNVIKNAGA